MKKPAVLRDGGFFMRLKSFLQSRKSFFLP